MVENPRFLEFTIKELYKRVSDDAGTMLYLPALDERGKKMPNQSGVTMW